MITDKILALPGYIEFEGITFRLEIWKEAEDEIRLGYTLGMVAEDSKHWLIWQNTGSWFNLFNNDDLQGFLYLMEGITDDNHFEATLDDCKQFLKLNKLL